ncbi:MAG: lactate utilization protein [Gammaproteobacteria bacterium]
MSDPREIVLGAVRTALARAGGSADRHERGTLAERLEHRPIGPQPRLGDDPIAHFTGRMEAAAATWTRVATALDAVQAVQRYAQTAGHDTVVAVDHPALHDLPWPPTMDLRFRVPVKAAVCVVTLAELGIAETGSLMLCASPATPTLFNFLPDTLICLLPADRVVAHLEDAWRWLRENHATLPRAVNLVTGPSRTADVEQTLQLGAHGPRQLHAVLIDGGWGTHP